MPAVDKLYMTCTKCENTFFISPASLVPEEASRQSYSQSVKVVCPNCRNAAYFEHLEFQRVWNNFNQQLERIEQDGWIVNVANPLLSQDEDA